MKPWRPYWKGIERAIESVVEISEVFHVDNTILIKDWVSQRTYIDMVNSEIYIDVISNALAHGHGKFPEWTVSSDETRYEVFLRLQLALDFCRGNVGKRKSYDWSGNSEDIYKDLLIDTWRRDALYWLDRCHPEYDSKRATEDILYNKFLRTSSDWDSIQQN